MEWNSQLFSQNVYSDSILLCYKHVYHCVPKKLIHEHRAQKIELGTSLYILNCANYQILYRTLLAPVTSTERSSSIHN